MNLTISLFVTAAVVVLVVLVFGLRYLFKESARVRAQLDWFEIQMKICPSQELRPLRASVLAYAKRWCTYPPARYARARTILAYLDGRLVGESSTVTVWDEHDLDNLQFQINSTRKY